MCSLEAIISIDADCLHNYLAEITSGNYWMYSCASLHYCGKRDVLMVGLYVSLKNFWAIRKIWHEHHVSRGHATFVLLNFLP